ncbi:uncharacterized protein A4U43_C08F27300 [Asparagus officinalis]|nr:uncharacterized protein A4U43_C08F27300 [Asparagus officinalis]
MSVVQDFGPLLRSDAALRSTKPARKHIMMAGGASRYHRSLPRCSQRRHFHQQRTTITHDTTTKNNNNNSKKPASGGRSGTHCYEPREVDGRCAPKGLSRKDICMKKLTKATKPTSKPKDVVKASVSVVYDAAIEAFEKASEFRTGDPMTREAVSVCEELLLHSKDDLNDTINRIEVFKLQDLPKISPVLNVWLSAVRSYQETCIDAFPEGEARNKMKEAMKVVNELTGNALGIVSKAANYLAKLNVPGLHRRYVIFVKAGTYDEQVIIDKKMVNVTIYGEGNTKTIVTGNKNYKAGVQTFKTATFAVVGDGFMGLNMGFANTAGPEGEQAVALRVQGDSAVFLNCRMEAYQDTLYAQAKRQFYRNCIITGTVDYLFGDAAAVSSNPASSPSANLAPDNKTSLRPTAALTLMSRPASSSTTAESSPATIWLPSWPSYLPWGDTTVGQDTCEYAEYKNTGEGASTATRAAWKGAKKELTKEEASKFVPSAFLVDVAFWSKKSGVSVPLRLGFFQ